MGSGRGIVEVINSKGCSRIFVNSFSSMNLRAGVQMSPASTNSFSSVSSQQILPLSNAPFSGLVICVIGLSKEARKQVMAATERLGGQYSGHLHPQCTHLVVQCAHGHKFEHALKHGRKSGLFIVTLGWFVDSVRKNVRLSEPLYSAKINRENEIPKGTLNELFHCSSFESSCLPVVVLEHFKQSDIIEPQHSLSSGKSFRRISDSTLSGHSFYVDTDVSAELQHKVVEAATAHGATLKDQWVVQHKASHVVCEGPSFHKYVGHADNLVTPLWVLKTAKEKCLQRLVHISADLAQQIGTMLETIQSLEDRRGDNQSHVALTSAIKLNLVERQKIALAKTGVRRRRGLLMQRCQSPVRPITPRSLLDSICWSISEPTCSASIYTGIAVKDFREHPTAASADENGNEKDPHVSFVNCYRNLTESEKTAMILKNHFLTVLFPIDRFSEMGPCSRTFFSDSGFTCKQVLDYVYAFYQEKMTNEEIELAIHTDSSQADLLRTLYSRNRAAEGGFTQFKRIEFLGSRTSFEMLKRIGVDNNCNVYELLIRARDK